MTTNHVQDGDAGNHSGSRSGAPPAADHQPFHDLAGWQRHPELAFDQWLARHEFGRGTIIVYRSMWGKLLRWSAGQGHVPLSWTAEQIGEFLDTHGLFKHHRYKYTRLIERVFHHLSLRQAGLHNPGSQAVRAHLADGENDPTAFLLPEERTRIIDVLLAPVRMPARDGAPLSPTAWKRWRDTALLAILLGGGLKVGEARKLDADHVGIDASALRMVRPDNGRAYEVPVFSFARVPILAWLAVRAASGASGELLFPATVEGRALHPASLYRRVEMLLDEAGVLAGRSERASPQTLRNSYGAMHFDAKAGPAAVSQYMGMRDTESGWRLRSAYEAWQARTGQTMIANRTPAESSVEDRR